MTSWIKFRTWYCQYGRDVLFYAFNCRERGLDSRYPSGPCWLLLTARAFVDCRVWAPAVDSLTIESIVQVCNGRVWQLLQCCMA